MVTATVGELVEAVDELTVAPVSDQIVEVLGLRDRLEATVLEALCGFFATGGHDVDGYRSAVGWLKANVAVTDSEAVALATRARRLAGWPTLAKLAFDGSLTTAQVAVVARLVPRDLVDLYATHDAEVSPLLVGLNVGATRDAIARWVNLAHDAASPDPGEPVDSEHPTVDGFLHLSRIGADDRGRIDADLDPDTTAVVAAALTAATRPDAEGEHRVPSQRNAEALRTICRFYTDHIDEMFDRPRARTPQLVALIEMADLYKATLTGLGLRNHDDLDRFLQIRPVSAIEEGFLRHALDHATGRATTLDGHTLTPDAITTIFGAGSTLERVLLAEGRVLDHGRQVRLVTGPLRDTMIVRDMGCRFPSPTGQPCDAPITWIDGHHINHWRDGGVTSIDNTGGYCGSHHGVLHRTGWSMTTAPDGTHTITRPDGTVLTSPPPRRTRPPHLPLHRRAPEENPWSRPPTRPHDLAHDHDDDDEHDDPDDRPGTTTCGFDQTTPRATVRLVDDTEPTTRSFELVPTTLEHHGPVTDGDHVTPFVTSSSYPDMVVRRPDHPTIAVEVLLAA